ncbi:hypothetical protein Aeqsu_0951 [Aequorivita sublithincola DSM 14238]|uniref:Secretion system C-terminal sorting domain-containing protein n=1 Tax=Aequorivita sublithincola (strain DSM 14238 / LMG 21431 / ACAM 643 / 9-3) TaxID=746697 RepID=I3YTY5_AEQSU|nr:T9SS type A sorting domain-containing protein [Aequorivita sublithincola]AFL80453.1 hypothetical protein Aeqsu_0951 [Aequorivita sublithincola DSM 14238]
MKSFKTIFSALILCAIFQLSANAQLKTFTNSTGNNLWEDAANWSPGGVPQGSNDVLIPSGFEVDVAVLTAVNALTLEANAVLNIVTGSQFRTFGGATYAAGSIINFEGGYFSSYNFSATINGQLNIFGGDPKHLAGNILINNQMNVASGVLDLDYSGSASQFLTITSSGVMTVGDASFASAPFGGLLINEGLIQKTSGAGTFTISSSFENNDGTINIDSGSIMLSGLMTLTDGEYNVNSNGFLELNGDIPNFIIGTLTGQLDGPFIVDGGGLRIENNGVNFLDFSGPAGVVWRGGTLTAQAAAGTVLVNNGLINFTGTGSQQTQLAGGAVFQNEGTILFDAAANNLSIGQGSIFENRELGVITVVDGVNISGGPFINTGLIQKTTGTGTATLASLTNNSPGILSVETGNMSFNVNFDGDGIITGAGSIGTNYNTEIGQTIAPGNNGVGTLTYNNTLDFEATPDCIYQLEINGTAAGTEHDVFAITNKARLFGTLDIILGYNAQLNDEFVIMTFPNRNECELPAQVTASFGNGTYTYDVVCNPDNVTLKVVDIVLGLEDNQLSNAVLYPNPTSGNFTIDLGKNYSEINMNITNILGQVVAFERFANTDTLEINLQGSPGIYFVNITTGEDFSETLKVLKE